MVRTRFQSRFGTPIRPRNLTRTFKSLLSKAGLPHTIRIHDLRHTSASLALSAGVGLKTVSERLGHSSISITADIYTHVSLDYKRMPRTRPAASYSPQEGPGIIRDTKVSKRLANDLQTFPKGKLTALDWRIYLQKYWWAIQDSNL
ncbi:MAG TPA: site-specific integrase [Firmicutes bacterium]|nr:site-specific integrase [Candidatus Fermentithermobacillaceae bacterium]